MIETSHQGELPIHFFWPFKTQVSPSRFAVVVRPPDAPEPTSGSVRPKQPIFSKRAIGGSHFCFLLLRSRGIDGAHGQAVVDAEEGRDRRVDARHLHRRQAEQERTSSPAPVSLHPQSAEIQLLDRREQLEWECILDPVLVDDRCDLGLHERTHLFQKRAFLGVQGVSELIEVAVRSRQRLGAVPFRSRPSVFTGASTVMVSPRSWLW